MKTYVLIFIVCTLFAKVLGNNSPNWQDDGNENSGEQNDGGNGQQQRESNQNKQRQENYQQQTQPHTNWNLQYAEHPQLQKYINKINARLERVRDMEQVQELKQRLIRYAHDQLEYCRNHIDNSFDRPCLGRLTGSTMAMINNWENRSVNAQHY